MCGSVVADADIGRAGNGNQVRCRKVGDVGNGGQLGSPLIIPIREKAVHTIVGFCPRSKICGTSSDGPPIVASADLVVHRRRPRSRSGLQICYHLEQQLGYYKLRSEDRCRAGVCRGHRIAVYVWIPLYCSKILL